MTDEIMDKELKMVDFSGSVKESLLNKLLKMHRADNRSSKLNLKRVSLEDLSYVAAAGTPEQRFDSRVEKDVNENLRYYARDGAINY